MLKRYFWLAHGLLVTVAAIWGADIAKSYIRATLATPVAPERVVRQAPPVRSPRESSGDYGVIIERNIFNAAPPDKNKPPIRPRKVTPTPEATQLRVKLAGTVAGMDKQRFAIIEDLSARGAQAVYQVGDTIQNAYIIEIRPDCVVLDQDGKQESLCFEQDNATRSETRRRPAPSPPPRRRASTDDITRIDAATWRINRELILDNFSNLGGLSRQARVTPYIVQGQSQGFRLAHLNPGSLFRRMGLQTGDVIQKVNGLQITSPEEALRAFQQLQSASTIRLELLRRNRNTTLTYELR
jgi:general secretion pathway protein C